MTTGIGFIPKEGFPLHFSEALVADPGGLGGLTPSEFFWFLLVSLKIPTDLPF